MNYLDGLNERQKEAVLHKDGPLLIVAGAGAGKTKTVTHRIAYLIEQGVPPESILAVTFTNKAAKEMLERVLHLVDFSKYSFKPTISTFHSLGVKILKENAEKLGLSRFFTILDDGDSMSIIKESMKELGIDPKATAPRAVKSVISKNKNNFISPEEFASTIRSHVGQTTLAIWRKYEAKKKEEGSLDFDDLLLNTVILFDKNPEILEKYQDRFRYIHIDEYQDTNKVQYLITKMLAEKYKNICVVGDSDQNIYSWRGADIVNILNFEEDYPNAKVVMLEENYRSTKNILGVANAIIKKNTQRKDKNLFTKNHEGELISIFEAYNDRFEAEFVADKIVELLDARVLPEDIAVLYRANFQSRVIEESMLRYSIPYQVLGVKFFDRKEVKDTLSYLRLALNRDSVQDLKRAISYPKKGIGAATVDKIIAKETSNLPPKTITKINAFYEVLDGIKAYAENHLPSETIKYLIKNSGIEAELTKSNLEEDLERLENIKELVTFASKYDNFEGISGIEKLLEESALVSDQDTLDEAVEARKQKAKKGVKLMTVHASKGLEFQYVFIVGLESELFPHTRNDATELDLEEERRLFYVAVTRAKHKLFLSYATLRMLYGETKLQSPSQFIYDVPEEYVWREERSSSGIGDNVFYLD
jgi:DNA helicase-2/ATP-dependent DNA helicase PcrA